MNTAASVSALLSESKEWIQELADRGWCDDSDEAKTNLAKAIANKRRQEVSEYADRQRRHSPDQNKV